MLEKSPIVKQFVQNHVDRKIQNWLANEPERNPRAVIEEILNNQPAESRIPESDAYIRERLEVYLAVQERAPEVSEPYSTWDPELDAWICWDIKERRPADCLEHENCRISTFWQPDRVAKRVKKVSE